MSFQKCPACDGAGCIGIGFPTGKTCDVCQGQKIINSLTGEPPYKITTSTSAAATPNLSKITSDLITLTQQDLDVIVESNADSEVADLLNYAENNGEQMNTPTEKHLEKAREIVFKYCNPQLDNPMSELRTLIADALAERDAEIASLKQDKDELRTHIKALQETRRAASELIGKLEAKLAVAVEALKKLSNLEVYFKSKGGTYDPKLGCFVYDTIDEGKFNIAKQALASIEGEKK